jgi:SAM-dependent methyltransferase
MGKMDYVEKVEKELEHFRTVKNVHDLPEIYLWFAKKYWRPIFESVGLNRLNDIYMSYMTKVFEQQGKHSGTVKMISIGSGNCDLEVELGKELVENGVGNWLFDCLEMNPDMIVRGKELAQKENLEKHFNFVNVDIKNWKVKKDEYNIVIANHSLHHFVDLEILFKKIHISLHPDGYFLTNDMIGRNGHMRWPEVLPILNSVWEGLEDKYKYNHQLKRVDKTFVNWDCSQEGFEGIRAQNILSLLVKTFSFDLFLGFGNMIDIFIDRSFGHNYDPESEKDRQIIDIIACIDQTMLENGTFKPTHIVAAMTKKQRIFGPKIRSKTKVYKHLTPKYCVRKG